MTETAEAVSNHLVVLGGGFDLDPFGFPQLSGWATARLDRAATYYYENRDRFDQDGGLIVCTGWQTPTWIDAVTPGHLHEADEAAAYLMSVGVPHRRIEKEMTSTNTMTNMANTILEGLIKVEELNPENPVGFVSHPHHLKRVEMFAKKMGIPAEHVLGIPTKQQDHRLREFIARSAWRFILIRSEGVDQLSNRYETALTLGGGSVAKARMALARVRI